MYQRNALKLGDSQPDRHGVVLSSTKVAKSCATARLPFGHSAFMCSYSWWLSGNLDVPNSASMPDTILKSNLDRNKLPPRDMERHLASNPWTESWSLDANCTV